jgi:cobyrinic acid a,c-diamide synthase
MVIAGVASGVGKTTIATGLMGALVARGLRVQGFKIGPDYIDPSYHTQVTGRPSRNLDTWLVPANPLKALYARAMATADVAVVEGVMGLYDGRHGGGEEASTAEIAKLLGLPVVLVADVSRQSRSAAATVLGFQKLDPAVCLVGVILNRVGSEAHRATVTQAIEDASGLPVLGALGRETGLAVPERYLGLVPRFENSAGAEFFARAVAVIERQVAVDRLLTLCEVPSPAPTTEYSPFPSEGTPARARLAVARDRAFGFYYADALDLLQAHGVELAEFSPLTDARLPVGSDGVYLGGGFPELFAAELAANRPLLRELRTETRRGLPIYAECGGLMYLARALVDAAGTRHRLAGLVPAEVSLASPRLALGYRSAETAKDTVLHTRGTTIHAHEFHYSRSEPATPNQPAYTVPGREPAAEGFAWGALLASYLHLHLAGTPGTAARFAATCAAWRAGRAA